MMNRFSTFHFESFYLGVFVGILMDAIAVQLAFKLQKYCRWYISEKDKGKIQ
jgi:hypothetical protein